MDFINQLNGVDSFTGDYEDDEAEPQEQSIEQIIMALMSQQQAPPEELDEMRMASRTGGAMGELPPEMMQMLMQMMGGQNGGF